MIFNHRKSIAALVFTVAVLTLAGCSGARRTTIEGYSDDMLNGKRVMVVLPDAADVVLGDPNAYAAGRGAAAESAREQLRNDMRLYFVPEIDRRTDSNTVLVYNDQPVGAMVPLNAVRDFPNGTPSSWDNVAKAGREGNLDYLIVLNNLDIKTVLEGTTRASEAANATFVLLDIERSKVMAKGRVSVSMDPMGGPGGIYTLMAEKIIEQLPFIVSSR